MRGHSADDKGGWLTGELSKMPEEDQDPGAMSGTQVPSVAELLKIVWSWLTPPGGVRGGELVHLTPHLTGRGHLSMELPWPFWSRPKGQGNMGIVCLSCLSVQGFRVLSNPSG